MRISFIVAPDAMNIKEHIGTRFKRISINITSLRDLEGYESSRFPRSIRFGVFAGVFLLGNRTYRAWGVKIGRKNRN